ncbi:hypothetical protein K438DRAFT_1975233 [Mycena galopus ATCC 62051]|nr:hypothetical protein K438DRAFT_1975233 [Mycena galopus ATCC 62051]
MSLPHEPGAAAPAPSLRHFPRCPRLAAVTVPAEFVCRGLQVGKYRLPYQSHLLPNMTIPRYRLLSARAHRPALRGSADVLPSHPTHVLAISPASSKLSSGKASIFAVPDRCPPPRTPSASGTATLPILPFPLPCSPSSTHTCTPTASTSSSARSSPSPRPSSRPSPPCSAAALHTIAATLASPPHLHVLAAHLASASSNIPTLLDHAGHVKELWQDMVALSMYDASLWDALGAMNVVAQ